MKFCIPATTRQKTDRVVPWCFKLGGAETTKLMQNILCPMGGSVALIKRKSQQAAAKQPAAKAARKGKGKGGRGKGETTAPVSATVPMGDDASSREKLYLDDCTDLLIRAFDSKKKNVEDKPEWENTVAQFYSYCLEFCWLGSLNIGDQSHNRWSTIRKALETFLWKSASRGADAEQPMSQALLAALPSPDSLGEDSGCQGEQEVQEDLDQAALAQVKDFVANNCDGRPVQIQPAYLKLISCTWSLLNDVFQQPQNASLKVAYIIYILLSCMVYYNDI